jgi:plastocyanin
MKKYILGISMLIAVIVVAVAACSKSGSTNNPTPTNPSKPTDPVVTADASVKIQGFAFSPASVTVKAGGTVQWKNVDSTPHTATDNNSAFDSGTLNTNGIYTHKFDTPGTYTYHCTFHSTMTNATVVVTQ